MCNKKEKHFYVKFVPYNKNTFQSLIGKTVKFSTVYEFNDFNELSVDIPVIQPGIEDEIKEKLSFNMRSSLIKKIRETIINADSEIDTFIKKTTSSLEEENYTSLPDRGWGTIIEHIGYVNTGILCLSNPNVFDNDAAQLMFAHYGENLKGLALIYSTQTKAVEVTYTKNESEAINPESYILNHISEHDDKKEYDDFLIKSPQWAYEQEHRLFNKPSIIESNKIGLTLRAVFYTQRLGGDRENSLKILENINSKFYQGDLLIKQITSTYGADKKFLILDTKPDSTLKQIDYCEFIKALN